MAIVSGSATIRFGVADTVSNLEENTFGSGKEDGGIELQANAGDVFIIPAGVAHKTFAAQPAAEFKLLTPGDGHGVAAPDVRDALAKLDISGFTMIGAYPQRGVWDFVEGDAAQGSYEKVWSVANPENDPILGKADEGLCGSWNRVEA